MESNANLKNDQSTINKDIRREPNSFENSLVVVTGFGRPSDAASGVLFLDNMRERIAQFLSYEPRHKLVFAPTAEPCLHTLDVGFELASRLKDKLSSPHLSMIAEDELNAILKNSIRKDEIIRDYIALTNWGILFEPELKLNLLSLFDSYSKSATLILINCGQADNDCFHLVSKHFNSSVPLGKLSPFIIS